MNISGVFEQQRCGKVRGACSNMMIRWVALTFASYICSISMARLQTDTDELRVIVTLYPLRGVRTSRASISVLAQSVVDA